MKTLSCLHTFLLVYIPSERQLGSQVMSVQVEYDHGNGMWKALNFNSTWRHLTPVFGSSSSYKCQELTNMCRKIARCCSLGPHFYYWKHTIKVLWRRVWFHNSESEHHMEIARTKRSASWSAVKEYYWSLMLLVTKVIINEFLWSFSMWTDFSVWHARYAC